MKSKGLLLLIGLLTMVSCGPTQNVTEEFILDTDSKLNNVEDMNILMDELHQFDSTFYVNNEGAFAPVIKEELPKTVCLKDEVSKLFDPDNGFCTLPSEVVKRFHKLKDKGKGWAPSYVVRNIRELPDSALYLPRTSIAVLLHSFKIKSTNGYIRTWVAYGSQTFNNLDVDRFIIKKGYNSFFYSLDCSGYFNAAIEGSGTVAIADIKASAKSALDQKKSMFIGGGVLISPIAAAFYGDALGVSLDTLEMIQILKQIESTPDLSENDSLILPSTFEAIWMSLEGNSSFNGEAQFSVSSTLGIGAAMLSSKGEAGAELSRKTSFTSYRTYYTDRKIIAELKPIAVKDVRLRRLILEKSISGK